MKILRQNNIDRWGRGEMECQSRNCCDHKQSGYILSKIVGLIGLSRGCLYRGHCRRWACLGGVGGSGGRMGWGGGFCGSC